MKIRNGREVGAKYHGTRAVSVIYHGLRIVWQAVSNCLAGGWWQHGHGWDYGTGWGSHRRGNNN